MKYTIDIEREVKFVKTVTVEAGSIDDAHDMALDRLKSDAYQSFDFASQSDTVLSINGVAND